MRKSFPLQDFRGVEIGQVAIFKDISGFLDRQEQELLRSIMLVLLFTGLLCAAIVVFLRKVFVKPVRQAAALADALADGNLDYQLDVKGNSEFKMMLKALCNGLQNLKKMQAETIRSAQLASIGELSASVAHEINNPISGVINYSQILLNQKDLSDRQSDLVTRIQKEGIRVADIVHNLLNYARDSKGKKSCHDLKQIVTNSLVLLNPKIKKKAVAVTFEWPESMPPIYCNLQQIEQVLINIFRNAYQALEQNPLDNRRIEVKAEVLKADECC
ncbi:MAG: HAMP domain-containing protein, partial [Phycisphaerae bacterium]|nr:HAMP domain-containing protein [Phycisphaerae bacterium]NIX27417.1 HAMP domain-containing protein [Phycisphaerae bacterium]